MANSIEILDEGRTLSLRYGSHAEEIVADTPEQATTALAGVLFEELKDIAHLEKGLLKVFAGLSEATHDQEHPPKYVTKAIETARWYLENKPAAENETKA